MLLPKWTVWHSWLNDEPVEVQDAYTRMIQLERRRHEIIRAYDEADYRRKLQQVDRLNYEINELCKVIWRDF